MATFEKSSTKNNPSNPNNCSIFEDPALFPDCCEIDHTLHKANIPENTLFSTYQLRRSEKEGKQFYYQDNAVLGQVFEALESEVTEEIISNLKSDEVIFNVPVYEGTKCKKIVHKKGINSFAK